MWLFAIVVVVVLGGVAVVAAGRGEPMARAYDDRPDALVPADRSLTGADLRRVRFSVALRGYRMSEVDSLLARLAGELEGELEGRREGRREDGLEAPSTAPSSGTGGGPAVVDPPAE